MVTLFDRLHPRGFEILAFPCNQFGAQEPHDEEAICKFVQGYNVKFQLFEKINVNGDDAHIVFRFLKAQLGGLMGSSIKWNFTKFLCDRNGLPVKRFGPPVNPLAIEDEIVELLNQPIPTRKV